MSEKINLMQFMESQLKDENSSNKKDVVDTEKVAKILNLNAETISLSGDHNEKSEILLKQTEDKQTLIDNANVKTEFKKDIVNAENADKILNTEAVTFLDDNNEKNNILLKQFKDIKDDQALIDNTNVKTELKKEDEIIVIRKENKELSNVGNLQKINIKIHNPEKLESKTRENESVQKIKINPSEIIGKEKKSNSANNFASFLMLIVFIGFAIYSNNVSSIF